MTKQSNSEKSQPFDLGAYMEEALADPTARRSRIWRVGKSRWPSGLRVEFEASILAPHGGPIVILRLEEKWKPSRPDAMLPLARKRYFKARNAAIKEARRVGDKVAQQFPNIPMVLTHPEPPERWVPPNQLRDN